jgi:hypothetical protein
MATFRFVTMACYRCAGTVADVAQQGSVMFKRAVCAVVIAAPTYVLAADIDMTSITCQELFFDQPPGKRSASLALNLQWFSGYYHHETGRTSIDVEKQNKLAVALGRYCGLHRQAKVFDVYGRLFRETYQGKSL